MFTEEIWKDLPPYYQISNFGNIRSCARGKWKLKQTQIVRDGYVKVVLANNRKYKSYFVHRLVAEAFVPNRDNKPQVNHKNGVKTDNRAVNLEWVSASENINHAYNTGLNKHLKYKIKCVETGEIFNGTLDVERKTGIRASTVWFNLKKGWKAKGLNFVIID